MGARFVAGFTPIFTLRGVWLIGAVVLLNSCGFHLRTWDLSNNVDSFFVEVAGNNPLAPSLHRALQQAGVTAAESATSADLVVRLLDMQRSRRGVSVTPRARVAEYQLNLSARYSVSRSTQQLLAPQWARSYRVFRVDRDNLVGSNEEQALLEREMQGDLVQQIIRAVNAVTTEAAGAA